MRGQRLTSTASHLQRAVRAERRGWRNPLPIHSHSPPWPDRNSQTPNSHSVRGCPGLCFLLQPECTTHHYDPPTIPPRGCALGQASLAHPSSARLSLRLSRHALSPSSWYIMPLDPQELEPFLPSSIPPSTTSPHLPAPYAMTYDNPTLGKVRAYWLGAVVCIGGFVWTFAPPSAPPC